MKEEEQRVVIAEWCGWKAIRFDGSRCFGVDSPTAHHAKEVPDYLNDLNAMHELEKKLPDSKKYEDNLLWICDHDWQHANPKTPRNPIYATAAQRAEALLSTWEVEGLT